MVALPHNNLLLVKKTVKDKRAINYDQLNTEMEILPVMTTARELEIASDSERERRKPSQKPGYPGALFACCCYITLLIAMGAIYVYFNVIKQ